MLKVYQWERDKWPVQRRIIINRWQQEQVIAHLAREMDIFKPILTICYKSGVSSGKGGGYYLGYRTTKKPWDKDFTIPGYYIGVGTKTNLGTLVHEFAHHVVSITHPEVTRHHGKVFKKTLRTCYSKANKFNRMWA